MRTSKPTGLLRVGNALVRPAIKLGLPVGPWALLTVPGRKSGIPRTTPIAYVTSGGGYTVMSPYGPNVDWVKNVRAAGRAQLTRRGRTFEVTATELPKNEAAGFLRDALAGAPRALRRLFAPYFDTDPSAPLEDWEREAANHPVFRFDPHVALR